MDAQLVERIYECSFVPELWPAALNDLAKIASARTGFLFVSRGDIHRWASSNELGIEAMGPLVKNGYVARSQRFTRFVAARHRGFLTEAAVYTEEEWKADPYLSRFHLPARPWPLGQYDRRATDR